MHTILKQYVNSCLLVVSLAYSNAVDAESLNIAVASNFVAAMEPLKLAFEHGSEHELRIIRGSSGKHYAQIINGAPFDVFLSADQTRPRRLVEEGVASIAGLSTYAEGQLALWSRQADLTLSLEYLLNTDSYNRIAIANPRLAPYGQAASEVLANLGLESLLDGRLVMGENVAQAFQFAFSGNAELGLVSYSQTLAPALSSRGSVWLVPVSLYQPIRQDMLIIRQSAAATAFADFMKSTNAQDILLDNGYLLPKVSP